MKESIESEKFEIDQYYIGCTASQERFSGIYKTAGEVPSFSINPFETEEWVEANKLWLTELKQNIGVGWNKPDDYFYPLIPIVRSKIAEKKLVNIVDIGGGCGENYINLIRFFSKECFDYHVIEQERNCQLGGELELPGNIYFHVNQENGLRCLSNEANELLKKADICLLVGTIQYFPSYKNLLKEIADSGVEYILIVRTMITLATDTFFTRQYIAPDVGVYKDIVVGDIPVAVINRHELNRCLDDLGYDVCLDLFGLDYSYKVRNLPKPYCDVEYRNMLYQSRKYRCS